MSKKQSKSPWAIYQEDCWTGVPRHLPKGEAMLAAIDCPYNIGQQYADYVDKKTQDEYVYYIVNRIDLLRSHMHPHGSIWLAMNDANVSEIDVACKAIGLFPRRRVIWYQTFGQNGNKNFTSSHVTWLYYTLHKTKFTFNADDPLNRIPSARQSTYNDKRANPKGRLPDDTWILRPQLLPDGFKSTDSCWYFPRLCGTFKAKVKDEGIPNQMPVAMMERIVRICSNPGDLVVDTFGGTFTTGEAALRLGRRFIGFDLSAKCVKYGEQRLKAVKPIALVSADEVQLKLFEEKNSCPPSPKTKRKSSKK
jgi:site-specific DNA-methyltransferase (adenine-specific)